jgi:hypothetical protein
MVIKPVDEFEQWFRVSGKWRVDESDLENPIIHVQGGCETQVAGEYHTLYSTHVT